MSGAEEQPQGAEGHQAHRATGRTQTSEVSPLAGGRRRMVAPYCATRASSICPEVLPAATMRATSSRTAMASDAEDWATERSSQLGQRISASMAAARWASVWCPADPSPPPTASATASTTIRVPSPTTGLRQSAAMPRPGRALVGAGPTAHRRPGRRRAARSRPVRRAGDQALVARPVRAAESMASSSDVLTGPAQAPTMTPRGSTRKVMGGDSTP